MDAAAVALAFGAVFVAELPDKTMLATIVLSARSRRPLAVWAGAAVALTAQMVIASAAGRLLDELPARPVRAVVAVLFAVGAVLLWRSADEPEGDEIVGDEPAMPPTTPWWRVSATVCAIVFVAEWGDLTQLTAASLAAETDAVSVFVGASAAMVTVAGIGALAGRALLRVLPEGMLRRVAAVVFGALTVIAGTTAIAG